MMNNNEMALLNNLIALTEAIAAAKKRLDRHGVRITNLEARIDALEVSIAGGDSWVGIQ